MKLLVTGGVGMIGSALVKKLVKQGHDVSVIDNLWRGKIKHLEDENGKPVIDLSTRFFNIDLTVSCPTELLQGVDYVFHLADIVGGINYVFNNQGHVFRNNILINSNVISAVRSSKIKGFIYVGTACSFPQHLQQNSETPYPLKEEEQYPANPESSYGWSKLMGEYEALLMEKETGIPVSILVLHNVYGAPTDYSTNTSQVIPSLILKAINFPNEEFVVWGSGNQGRAFVYIDDVVEALLKAMKHGLGKGPIQIGPSHFSSIKDVAQAIVKISGKSIPIKFDTSRPEGDKSRCADYSKAKHILNWAPTTSIEEGLYKTYSWIFNQVKTKK